MTVIQAQQQWLQRRRCHEAGFLNDNNNRAHNGISLTAPMTKRAAVEITRHGPTHVHTDPVSSTRG